jgi:hypothetical protein
MGSQRGAPLVALRSRKLRLRRSNCETAWGSDADRHDKVLIYLEFNRSRFDVYSQSAARSFTLRAAPSNVRPNPASPAQGEAIKYLGQAKKRADELVASLHGLSHARILPEPSCERTRWTTRSRSSMMPFRLPRRSRTASTLIQSTGTSAPCTCKSPRRTFEKRRRVGDGRTNRTCVSQSRSLRPHRGLGIHSA